MTLATKVTDQSILHPIPVDERIDLIDVVRGFALFGVLLANLVWATTDVVLTDARIAGLPTAPVDRRFTGVPSRPNRRGPGACCANPGDSIGH
jgi:hypothetical protein